jgi:hypothetical protein
MRRMHALPGASSGTRKLRGRSVFREAVPSMTYSDVLARACGGWRTALDS